MMQTCQLCKRTQVISSSQQGPYHISHAKTHVLLPNNELALGKETQLQFQFQFQFQFHVLPISLTTPKQKHPNPPKIAIEYSNPVLHRIIIPDSIPRQTRKMLPEAPKKDYKQQLSEKDEKEKEQRHYCGNMAAISSSVKTMSCTGSCLRSRSCDS
jgi:hypothetical protein